jgi:hypothetical protein
MGKKQSLRGTIMPTIYLGVFGLAISIFLAVMRNTDVNEENKDGQKSDGDNAESDRSDGGKAG